MRRGILAIILLLLVTACAKDQVERNGTSAIPDVTSGEKNILNATTGNETVATTALPRSTANATQDYCVSLGGVVGKQCGFGNVSCDLWKLYVGECETPAVIAADTQITAYINEKLSLQGQLKLIHAVQEGDTIYAFYKVNDPRNTTILVTYQDRVLQAVQYGPLSPPLDIVTGEGLKTMPPAFQKARGKGLSCGEDIHGMCIVGTCRYASENIGECS